jgi:hypothetical protein
MAIHAMTCRRRSTQGSMPLPRHGLVETCKPFVSASLGVMKAVTSNRRLPTIVEACSETLETGTPASAASLARINASCDANTVAVMFRRRVSRTSRPYLHLYPASHRQWACRLESAGLCVWAGQASWLSPAQYELTGQAAQVCVLTVRLPT